MLLCSFCHLVQILPVGQLVRLVCSCLQRPPLRCSLSLDLSEEQRIYTDKLETAQMEDRVEDLLQAGVLDPAKVTRSGLMNACGIAGIMLTTQVRM